MSHIHEQTRPDEYQFVFYVVRYIFLSFLQRTECVEPQKSLPEDFRKSEKENFVGEIPTPCLLRVQSRRTTYTVFQIDNWAKSLS